jgi:hypothetical protein
MTGGTAKRSTTLQRARSMIACEVRKFLAVFWAVDHRHQLARIKQNASNAGMRRIYRMVSSIWQSCATRRCSVDSGRFGPPGR